MIFDKYVAVWFFFIPISSIVIFPEIKGSLPSYLFSITSIAVMIFNFPVNREIYIKKIFLFVFVFLIFTALSQLGLLLTNSKLENIVLNNYQDSSVFLRLTLFTQFLYLMMGFLTFMFVYLTYNESFEKYLFKGACFLAIYGVYEVVYFLIFSENGDFLSNRHFADLDIVGSLFQTLQLGGIQLQRLKSLTGEPSMYAFTILPYWIYSIHKKKVLYQVLFLCTLILSTSTTAISGVLLYMILRIYFFGIKDKCLVKFLLLLLLLCLLGWNFVFDLWNSMILDKITLNHLSGIERSDVFLMHLNYFLDEMSLINQSFGIGFGYIRSTELLSTLLVNVGIVGFVLLSILFLYPVFVLKNDCESIGLKSILIVMYFMMMIAIPEFYYLSFWTFLGISYKKINKRKEVY